MGHFRVSNENKKIRFLKKISKVAMPIVILVAIASGFYCCRYGFPYPENPNSIIPNRELEAVIREVIKKPKGTIQPSDCLGIKELDISKTNYIKNLKGLEYFIDLEKLTVAASWVSDLSSISSLTNLKYLDLDQNNITDLSPLSGLVKLEYLNLYDNKVVDISPLLNLATLRELNLAKNPVKNVEVIEERMPNLNVYLE